MNNNLIYCLKCPFTGNVHYVGKSSVGLLRPMQHLTRSHSIKIREWVEDIKILGYCPIIEVLEKDFDIDFINDKEIFWIDFYREKGCLLLNSTDITVKDLYKPKVTIEESALMKEVAASIKNIRKINKLNQGEFSEKMGIGLRWLRKIESGSEDIVLSNLIALLSQFNLTLKLVKK